MLLGSMHQEGANILTRVHRALGGLGTGEPQNTMTPVVQTRTLLQYHPTPTLRKSHDQQDRVSTLLDSPSLTRPKNKITHPYVETHIRLIHTHTHTHTQ